MCIYLLEKVSVSPHNSKFHNARHLPSINYPENKIKGVWLLVKIVLAGIIICAYINHTSTHTPSLALKD